MLTDQKLEDLAGLQLFAGADRRQLDRIAQCCTQAPVSPGQVLCRQGALARQVLVVEDGHAVVAVDGQQTDVLVGGDCYGETAVLGTGRYDATVIAVDLMRVLVFTPAELSAVLATAPFVAERMLRARAARPGATPERRAAAVTVPAQRTGLGLPHAHA